jgi:protein TonB
MRSRTIAALCAALLVAAGAVLAAAPAKKAPRMNAYFATGFDDAAYQKQAVDKVLKAWAPTTQPAAGKLTVLISKIGRDGKLRELYFHKSSDDKAWDGAAEQAVAKAAPFPPLPKSYPHDMLEVHWHFEVK